MNILLCTDGLLACMLEPLETKRQSTPITQSTQFRFADSTTEGNYISGRLEVNLPNHDADGNVKNVWGPVYFDCFGQSDNPKRYCPSPHIEANVACWHMGYANEFTSYRIPYTQNMGPHLIDYMDCYGKESVADCQVKLPSKDDTCSQVLKMSCAKGTLKNCFANLQNIPSDTHILKNPSGCMHY